MNEDAIRRNVEFMRQQEECEKLKKAAGLPPLVGDEFGEAMRRLHGATIYVDDDGKPRSLGHESDDELRALRRHLAERPDRVKTYHLSFERESERHEEPATPEFVADYVDRIDAELAGRQRRDEVLADLRARRGKEAG
jgi:hypothetical protein